MVLLTFGLLSPNKGIENVLQGLPAVIKKHPDAVYIILGATHPHILKFQGDSYRIMLQQLVRRLGIGGHVIFQNRFVELNELCEFLGIADIYVTPYLEEAQIKTAYRRLAKEAHPDVGGSQEKFVQITEAYNALLESLL